MPSDSADAQSSAAAASIDSDFFRRIVENSPDLIAVLDPAQRYLFVNPRVYSLFGGSASDYIGKPIGQPIAPEDVREIQAAFNRLLAGGESVVTYQFELRNNYGEWKTLRFNASLLRGTSGSTEGIIVAFRDITDIRIANARNSQQEKFAAMGQMLTGAAHELNNPLTAILGVSDLLRESAGDDLTRRHANLLFQQARRAAGIVQNLLAFSRPSQQQRLVIRFEDVVRQSLLLHREILAQKHITVELRVPDNLPMIEGDQKLLLQVFENLLSNAERAISDNSDHGKITIDLALVGNRIRVTFADDGPGIPPENVDKLFDPFFTTRRPAGNPGLGLTISLAILKDHNGTIEVRSPQGGGAIFDIYIPIAEQAQTVTQPQAAAPKAAAPAEILLEKNVLVVDDEEGIREIIQDGLAGRGVTVDAVASAESAFECLEKAMPHAIICDFNLPGLSGEQFYRQVKARSGDRVPPFVFVTGELVSQPGGPPSFGDANTSILQKPFQISDLAAHLEKVLTDVRTPSK